MNKTFELFGYSQMIRIELSEIIDASCTCRYGTVHRDAWKEGKTICKHIKQALKEVR